MNLGKNKRWYIGWAIALLLALTLLIFLLVKPQPSTPLLETEDATPSDLPAEEPATPNPEIIGTSVQERPIYVYRFGTGANHLLFVGGIHGGYEWNSVVLAEELIAYLETSPDTVPDSVSISIIPNLNPDGVFKVLGSTSGFTAAEALAIAPSTQSVGRFNANGVDLNRNFDCKWQPESSWRGAKVSAGSAAFSEPEAKALRDYVQAYQPAAAFFWHSQANTVYASECNDGVLPQTLTLMNTYAAAANYNTQASFDAYPVTGDAEGWLASLNIPAITIELETRTDSEWARNLAGVKAILDLY